VPPFGWQSAEKVVNPGLEGRGIGAFESASRRHARSIYVGVAFFSTLLVRQ
jgi:hypothetical protein